MGGFNSAMQYDPDINLDLVKRDLPYRTLMLNIKGKVVPYAMQIPRRYYLRFKYLQGQLLTDPKIPDYIENFIKDNKIAKTGV